VPIRQANMAFQIIRERLRLRVMYAPDLRLDLWIEIILRRNSRRGIHNQHLR
jgi:hypothetical protein